MRKHALLFILAATVFNLIVMAALFFFAYSLYYLLAGRFFSPGINMILIFLIFAASVAATYFIHKAIVRFLLKKTSIGKYLHLLQ